MKASFRGGVLMSHLRITYYDANHRVLGWQIIEEGRKEIVSPLMRIAQIYEINEIKLAGD